MEKENKVVVFQRTISKALTDQRGNIQSMLPDHLKKDVDRYIKSAMLAIMRSIGERGDLSHCTIASLQTAIINAAETGLDFTPAKKHAYLVPFKDKAVFMPGYLGLVDLARRTGQIKDIDAHIVYENEYKEGLFNIEYGMAPKLFHKPMIVGERGKPIGVYAVATFNDGTMKPLYMSAEEVEKIRQSSKAKDSGPWKDWPEEMWKKCPIRRLTKLLPSSPELSAAIMLDDEEFGIDTSGQNKEKKPSGTDGLASVIMGSSVGVEDADFTDVEGDGESGEGNKEEKTTEKKGEKVDTKTGEITDADVKEASEKFKLEP